MQPELGVRLQNLRIDVPLAVLSRVQEVNASVTAPIALDRVALTMAVSVWKSMSVVPHGGSVPAETRSRTRSARPRGGHACTRTPFTKRRWIFRAPILKYATTPNGSIWLRVHRPKADMKTPANKPAEGVHLIWSTRPGSLARAALRQALCASRAKLCREPVTLWEAPPYWYQYGGAPHYV